MKTGLLNILLILLFFGCKDSRISDQLLRQGAYYTVEQGKAELTKHLGLNINAVTDPQGQIDESKSALEPAVELLVFSSNKPFSKNALIGIDAIKKAWIADKFFQLRNHLYMIKWLGSFLNLQPDRDAIEKFLR
jgi:hypothetical protein